MFDFKETFDESFLTGLEIFVVLFFWEAVLDAFKVDLVEFLAKTGFDVLETALVLFLDEDEIGFFATVFVVLVFVAVFFVDCLLADFSAILVEFFAAAIFLA